MESNDSESSFKQYTVQVIQESKEKHEKKNQEEIQDESGINIYDVNSDELTNSDEDNDVEKYSVRSEVDK